MDTATHAVNLITEAATAKPSATASPPTPTVTPIPTQQACWQAGGRLQIESIKTSLLPKPLEFRTYLPPCYDEQSERDYAVLFLIHGQSYNDDQWDRLGADESADRLIAAGEAAPFIIVMPRDRIWVDPTEDPFGEALIGDLIPYIEATYRTLPGREYRAIGGLSRGAAWAVHLGLRYWELFGIIGAHSLPVFWTDAPQIPAWLDEIPPEAIPRIFIDVGDHDRDEILFSTTWFGNLLVEKNIPHEWYLFAGYHDEEYWSAHVEQYLRFYTRDW
ncbi:MAG: alpha/beta hydrolase-fold protein [Anaerolineae bacterium]|nr:alpha/beta hydrolase-fold protein [Anaerolineae bacterium]